MRPVTLMDEWAEKNGYRRGKGWCAHSLRLGGRQRSCTCTQYMQTFLDHGKVWLDPEGGKFLLTHTSKFDSDAADVYAYEHGLSVEVNREGDDWYGYGTTAIRWRLV